LDIHAPEKLILNLKDFAVHIAVVTVGILMALGFEGVREVMHDRHLVRETRENFRIELNGDLEHSKLEALRVGKIDKNLDQLADELPGLMADHPEQIALRLKAVEYNSGYFFADNSWQAALSTGALAHMPTEEIQQYASLFYILRIYAGLQQQCIPSEIRARIFFASHPTLSLAQQEDGVERVLLFQECESELVQVGGEMQDQLERALKL
jgi:hypothetical protein